MLKGSNEKHMSQIYTNINNNIDLIINDVEVTVGKEGAINDAFNYIDKKVESGVKGIIDYFGTSKIFINDIYTYKTKTPNIINLSTMYNDLLKEINKGKKFHSISNKKTPVILGFNITLKDLTAILTTYKKEPILLKDTLTNFDKVLDEILNTKVSNIDFTNIKNLNKDLLKKIKDINTEINKVTVKTVVSDRQPIRKIVGNFEELKAVSQEGLQLGLNYTMEDLELIHELNEDIVAKLDIIYESFKKNKDVIKKEDLDTFVIYIGTMAKYLTAVTFLFYLYYQLTNMITGVVKIITMSESEGTLGKVSKFIKDGYNTLLKF